MSAQVNLDHCVIVSNLAGLQLTIVLWTLVNLVVVLNLVVGNPDRAQASGLGCHDVDTVTEVDGQLLNARASKLKNFVLHETALKSGFHQ